MQVLLMQKRRGRSDEMVPKRPMAAQGIERMVGGALATRAIYRNYIDIRGEVAGEAAGAHMT